MQHISDQLHHMLVDRRRVGHWLTDATALAGLLPPGAECSMTLQTPAWGSGWRPSLTLRWSQTTSPAMAPVTAATAAEKDAAMGSGDQLGVEEGALGRGPGGGGRGGGMDSMLDGGWDQLVEHDGRDRAEGYMRERGSESMAGWQSVSGTFIAWLQRACKLALGWSSFSNHAFNDSVQSGPGDSQLGTLTGMPAEMGGMVSAAVGGESVGGAKVVPLFTGGNFDAEYNIGREEVHVEIPQGTARVLLVATITGPVPPPKVGILYRH